MAFWGPLFVDTQEHSQLTCLAALQQIKNIENLEPWADGKDLSLRVGMETSTLVMWNMGYETQKSFTVMRRYEQPLIQKIHRKSLT